MGRHYIGVDVGTGSVRAGVFDASGRLAGIGRHDIRLWRDAGHRVEQSSDDIWRAVCASVRGAVASAGVGAGDIAAIGFDATCSLVLLDAGGRPVAADPAGDDQRNVIVWMDHRALDQAARINAGGHRVLDYVGGRISPEMETPKLLWLAENLPDCLERSAHLFDLTDFLTWRATGSLARSVCTVACKWTYLPHDGGWQADYFRQIGLGMLADDGFAQIGTEVVPPATPLGDGLTRAAAEELGLVPGTAVAAGLIDAHAGAVGTLGADGPAAIEARLAYVLGTSACTLNVTRDPTFVPGVWGPYRDALLPGLWLNEGGQSAAGAAIEALLALHPEAGKLAAAASAEGRSLAAYAEAEAEKRGGAARFAEIARGVHVVPEFLGNRAPFADPEARAVISGLGLDGGAESLAAMYLSGLASVGYGLVQILGALAETGVDCELIAISGGAGSSPLVRQVLADATGLAVAAPETAEPVLLGSAILAAVAVGDQPDLTTAMTAMSRFGAINRPDEERHRLHHDRFGVFVELQAMQRRSRGL